MSRLAYEIVKEQESLYEEHLQIIPQKDFYEIITPFVTPLGDGIMMHAIHHNGLYLVDDCMDTIFMLSSLGLDIDTVLEDMKKIIKKNNCELTHDESIIAVHPSVHIAVLNLVNTILEIYDKFVEIKVYETNES